MKKTKRRTKRIQDGDVADVATQLETRAMRGNVALFKLVPGTQLFAQAVHDPFAMIGKKPKMPMFPMLPTMTVVNYINDFTMMTGTGSSGFVAVNPARTLCNDLSSITYTDGSYTGTSATTFPTIGTGIQSTLLTGPYACLDYSGLNGLRARIIGVGLEVTYSGQKLFGGGTIHALSHPDRSTVLGNQSHDSLGGFLHAKIESVVDEEGGFTTVRLTRPMTEAADTKFLKFVSGVGYVYASDESTQSSDDSSYMAISVSGVAGAPFRVRVYSVVELYGKQVMPMASLGIADKPGADAVVSHHVHKTHAPQQHAHLRKATHFSAENARQKRSLMRSIGDFVVKNQSHFIAGAKALGTLVG